MNEDNWQELVHIRLIALGAMEIYETECPKLFRILNQQEDHRHYETLQTIGEALYTIGEKIQLCFTSDNEKA